MSARAALVLMLAATSLAGPGAALAASDDLTLTDRSRVSPRLIQLDFTTPAIAGGTGARVLLPPGYGSSGGRYPVLYLLHRAGYDETSWSTEGSVQRIVGDRRLIVVMPRGGGNGYYTDWYNGGELGPPAYEAFHVRQLVPWIDEHFRTRAKRAGRATAGFSMGGFGAMSYAARHPDAFSGAFSFSGAIDTNYGPFRPIGEGSSVSDGGEYGAIWGLRAEQEVRWRARNPEDLAPNLRGMTLQIRTGNGQGGGDFGGPPFDPIEFGVHEMAYSMDARLDDLGISHLLEDYGPGAHEFPYYRRDLRRSLPAIMASFRDPPRPPRRFSFRAVERRYSAFGYRVRLRRAVLEFSRLEGAVNGRRFSLAGSGTARVTTPAKLRPGRRYAVRTRGVGGPRTKLAVADRRGRLRLRVPLGEANPFQQYTPEAEAAGTEVRQARVRIRGRHAVRSGPRRRGPERSSLWRPRPDDRWQYQLEGSRRFSASGGIDVEICQVPFAGGGCVRPDVFDIDLYQDGRVSGNDGTVNTAAVEAIHDRRAHAVCYLSAGTAERFRPDYRRYVRFDRRHGGKLLGKPFSDRFSNEYWLNLNNGRGQRDFVLERMRARTRKCARAGFDAVEYDVVDAWAQGRRVTGWRISGRTQLRYNRRLARIAHANGLSVALKNDIGQLAELQPSFEFAINEQCLQYRECDNKPPGYRAFTDAGKAVLEVEYRTAPSRFCAKAARLGLSAIKKARDFSLEAKPWRPCR